MPGLTPIDVDDTLHFLDEVSKQLSIARSVKNPRLTQRDRDVVDATVKAVINRANNWSPPMPPSLKVTDKAGLKNQFDLDQLDAKVRPLHVAGVYHFADALEALVAGLASSDLHARAKGGRA